MEPENDGPNPTTEPPVNPIVDQSVSQPNHPTPSKKKFTFIIIISIVIFLLTISGAAGFHIYKNVNTKPDLIACTQEARICPDGSSVERTGPSCEFAPCPTSTPDPTANWKIYTSRAFNYTFEYPASYKLSDQSISYGERALEAIRLEKDVEWGEGAYGEQTNLKGAVLNLTIYKSIDISETSLKKIYGDQIILEKIMLDNREATEVKGEYVLDRYIYLQLNPETLYINSGIAESNEQKRDKYLKEIDQILSTFKFTE